MRAGPSSRARRCTTPPPAVTAIVIFLRWRSGGKLSVTQRELGNGFCPSRQLGWGVCNAKRVPFNIPLQGSWKAAVPNGSCLIESRPAVVHVVGRRSSGSLRHKGQLRPPGPPHGIGSETSICRAGQSLPPRAAGRRRTPTHSDSGSTSPHSRVYWEATGVSLSTGPKCCPTGHGGLPGPRIANGSPGAPSRETHRSERGRQAGQRSQSTAWNRWW